MSSPITIEVWSDVVCPWCFIGRRRLQKALNKLGLGTIMKPLSTSCVDHEGSRQARLHTWDGKAWNYSSDWMEADDTIIKPLVKQFADKYAAEKKLTRRTGQDCQS